MRFYFILSIFHYRFMLLIRNGYLSLYGFRDGTQNSFDSRFLVKRDGKSMDLPNLTFRRNMIDFLDDCPEVTAKLEGISGPSFSKSLTQASLFNPAGDEKVLWLKGNHQAALIDIPTMEETDRAPLFGTVNNYPFSTN